MNFEAIEIDTTYKIRHIGSRDYTFGTVIDKSYDEGAREHTVTWQSDHPDASADNAHWAFPEQVICQVADGTYLGDNGRPTR